VEPLNTAKGVKKTEIKPQVDMYTSPTGTAFSCWRKDGW